jgi:hypothetical protein
LIALTINPDPLYTTKSEPIHRVGGSPKAIPINPDRL